MSRLIDFYRGAGTDAAGRTLADVWSFSDEAMEMHHDFIQWLFPLREPSRFNPDAPLMTDADAEAFQTDGVLRANLLRSLECFLAFLGLERKDGAVVPAADFATRRMLWLYPNHNWLRITRVLHSLRLLGVPAEAHALFQGLEHLRRTGSARIPDDTRAYWQAAAAGNGQR